MKQENCLSIRDNYVRKANELIQKSRFSLSTQQQKIILYLISQISPQDREFHVYSFSIGEFCKVCGLTDGGPNYAGLKEQIKRISDKSMWLTSADGKRESLIRWIEEPEILLSGGTVELRLNEKLRPYLLELKRNFTQYQLIYTLFFRSKYSIRLYELACSIHFNEMAEYKKRYNLDELKKILDSEGYRGFRDFRRRVLDTAVREINEHSDKTITYETITHGRKVLGIEFTISSKDSLAAAKIRSDIEHEMGFNQMTLWDSLVEKNLV